MHDRTKTLIRTIQTTFPALLNAKFAAQRLIRRTFRTPHEADFLFLKHFSQSPTDVFLDVGGNRGQSIDSIRFVNTACTIHSFEPNTLLSSRLEKLFQNDPKVHIHHFGLGSEEGSFTLFVPYYKKFMFDGLASFHEQEARDWLKQRIFRFDERKLHVKQVTCRVQRMDSLEFRPSFIKMDVQGFELEVLKGGEQTLRESQPVILLESPNESHMSYLSQFGYKLWTYRNGKLHAAGPGAPSGFFITPSAWSRISNSLAAPESSGESAAVQ